MVQITSRDKEMFPGITKGELVDYYRAVAPVMLPHLVDRPLTLERFPNGIGAGGFMQKNAPGHFPSFIRRFAVDKREGETIHPVIDDLDGLLYLANQNTVTFHAPTFTIAGGSDRLIFDLDPPPEETERARAAVRVIQEFLSGLDLPAFLLTTGSKGYHLVTPLDGSASWVEVAETAQGLGRLAVAHAPNLLTLEFQKKNRGGRVFVDWLRNGFGATAVVPWSARPRPGAPVAMPIRREELDTTVPDRWTIRTASARRDAGLWDGFAGEARNLRVAHPAVMALLDTARLELPGFDRS